MTDTPSIAKYAHNWPTTEARNTRRAILSSLNAVVSVISESGTELTPQVERILDLVNDAIEVCYDSR